MKTLYTQFGAKNKRLGTKHFWVRFIILFGEFYFENICLCL